MRKSFSLKAAIFVLALFAFAGLAFSSSKAKAAEEATPAAKSTDYSWTYDADADAIVFTNTTSEQIKLNILNFGDKDSAKKGKADAQITVEASSSASFSLKDKSKGINYKPAKDLNLFVTSNKITKAEYTADIKVSKTSVGKVTAVINYAVLGSTQGAVEVKSSTPEDKKTFVAAPIFKFAVYDKATKNYVRTGDGSEFTGEVVQALLEEVAAGKKYQLEFFIPGTSGASGVRPSPVAKVSLKKQGKAVTVKYDEKVGAIALKNGYDFAVSTVKVATGGTVAFNEWNTILPYNKNATSDVLTVATADYSPAKFDKENEANNVGKFTNKKIKNMSVKELAGEIESDFYVYYRKSAAVGKPASAVNAVICFKVKAEANAPVIKDNAVTTGPSFKFALENAEGDAAAKAYEYAFVKNSDAENVDLTTIKWTKFSGKAIKVKSVKKTNKYALIGSTDKPAAQEGTLSEFTMIVRRAGVKVKTSKTGETEVVRPSKIRKINFTVDSDGNVTAFTQTPEPPITP